MPDDIESHQKESSAAHTYGLSFRIHLFITPPHINSRSSSPSTCTSTSVLAHPSVLPSLRARQLLRMRVAAAFSTLAFAAVAIAQSNTIVCTHRTHSFERFRLTVHIVLTDQRR